MKLRIRAEEKEKICELWLEYDDDEVCLKCRDKEGEMFVASIKPDKSIFLHTSSGFKFEK